MNSTYAFQPGNTPLLVNVPHAGTYVPDDIRASFVPAAAELPDTDWFVDRLYQWVVELGAGLMVATHSRYVIDLNRPPDDQALYQTAGTRLVPEITFSDTPIYQPGVVLNTDEVECRRTKYWQPYHDKLTQEMNRIREKFGFAILIDAHSILSRVPMLFDGRLPDLNLGSNRGQSAASDVILRSVAALSADKRFDFVVDGRFRGGYITRHYGQPDEDWHALQLEMSQRVYMREQPPVFDPVLAGKIRPVLESWMGSLLDWTPDDE